ncbi:MAG: hypothetical protein HY069_00085 [Chlamydiia bacterium]|nr:hypothetical protein [Chlamydiia bacterium]
MTSCTAQRAAYIADDLSPRKQKQKIALLQKKLEAAARDEEKKKQEILELQEAIRAARLALIRKELNQYEAKKHPYSAELFQQEREFLQEVLQYGTNQMAKDAELLLERILRIITEESSDS